MDKAINLNHAMTVLDQEIKKSRKRVVSGFWEFVALLRTAKEYRIWEFTDYESWAAYLAQPEISMAVRTADRLIGTYVTFREVGAPIGALNQTRAKLIAPHLTVDNKEELVEKAISLSYSDLKKEIGPEEKAHCEHEWEIVKRCRHCGELLRNYPREIAS